MPDANKPYAGDIDAAAAWTMLRDEARAVLVDVRTKPEWTYVGVPDLRPLGKETVFLEWQRFPSMQVDSGFVPALVEALKERGVNPDDPVLFLCRSGARSRAAAIALTEAGFTQALNVADGFEGPPDSAGHRGVVAGWKASDLPWAQG